jgi:hypothetical protein
MSAGADALLGGIGEEADAVDENSDFSAQRHFNTASAWARRHYLLGCGAIALAILGGGTILYPPWFSIWLSGIAAMTAAGFAAAGTLLNARETSTAHYRAGNAYLELRNRARSFKRLDLVDPNVEKSELVRRVRDLSCDLSKLNATFGALFTPQWAYLKARRDIHRGTTRNRLYHASAPPPTNGPGRLG